MKVAVCDVLFKGTLHARAKSFSTSHRQRRVSDHHQLAQLDHDVVSLYCWDTNVHTKEYSVESDRVHHVVIENIM